MAKKGFDKKGIEKGKTMAALSYLWIAGLIIMLTEKKNKYVKFHAKQGTALFLLSLIPGIGLLVLLVNVYGIIMSLQGKAQKIPLVYDLGEIIAKIFKVK